MSTEDSFPRLIGVLNHFYYFFLGGLMAQDYL